MNNDGVLQHLFRNMPPQHRAILCSVEGDPFTADKRAWAGIPWQLGAHCPLLSKRNNYVAVSSFLVDDDGKWRRRKAGFGGLHAVMVDDLGTKLPMKALEDMGRSGLYPTLAVETSPGNYQAIFFLRQPILDMVQAEDGIRRMIEVLTGGGNDPGMSGVTRVFRLPGGINGKAKYRSADGTDFACRVVYWKPEVLTDWAQLAHYFGFVSKVRVYVEPGDGVTQERIRGFQIVKRGLEALRAIKKQGRGWIEIRCPWVADHTDRADSGAAVASPAAKNGYFGGYRCHHGHCANRGWSDLENWVGEELSKEAAATAGMFTGLIK